MGTTQLVVSELVTNACKYAPGPVLLDLHTDGDIVKVSVWDTDPTLVGFQKSCTWDDLGLRQPSWSS
jgi:anti-sigma regulatory factor (Ser/Thr protein kinase)